jgi:hypothetical protein
VIFFYLAVAVLEPEELHGLLRAIDGDNCRDKLSWLDSRRVAVVWMNRAGNWQPQTMGNHLGSQTENELVLGRKKQSEKTRRIKTFADQGFGRERDVAESSRAISICSWSKLDNMDKLIIMTIDGKEQEAEQFTPSSTMMKRESKSRVDCNHRINFNVVQK